MIDLSPSSLRVMAIMIMGAVWFYLFVGHIQGRWDDEEEQQDYSRSRPGKSSPKFSPPASKAGVAAARAGAYTGVAARGSS